MTGGGFSPSLLQARVLCRAAVTLRRRIAVATKAASAVSGRRGLRLQHFFKKLGWTVFRGSLSLLMLDPTVRRAPEGVISPSGAVPATHVGKPPLCPQARAASVCGRRDGACKGSFLMTMRMPQAWSAGFVQRLASKAAQTGNERERLPDGSGLSLANVLNVAVSRRLVQ